MVYRCSRESECSCPLVYGKGQSPRPNRRCMGPSAARYEDTHIAIQILVGYQKCWTGSLGCHFAERQSWRDFGYMRIIERIPPPTTAIRKGDSDTRRESGRLARPSHKSWRAIDHLFILVILTMGAPGIGSTVRSSWCSYLSDIQLGAGDPPHPLHLHYTLYPPTSNPQ